MKKQKTNTQLKTIAQRALESEYGFAPKLKNIVLLEANGTGEYILFEVNGKEYSFNSYMMGESHPFPYSVWCGKGTITRKEVR